MELLTCLSTLIYFDNLFFCAYKYGLYLLYAGVLNFPLWVWSKLTLSAIEVGVGEKQPRPIVVTCEISLYVIFYIVHLSPKL